MITEEAGPALTHRPSHRAQPPVFTRDPSQRFFTRLNNPTLAGLAQSAI